MPLLLPKGIKNNIPYVIYSGVGFYQRKEIKDILCYLRLIVCGDDIAFKRVINEPKRTFGRKKLEILQNYADSHNLSLLNALYEIESSFKNESITSFVALIKKFSSEYKNIKLSELFISVLNESGYEEYLRASGEDERLQNLAELKQSIFDYEKAEGEEINIADYLAYISLYTNMDRSESNDSVKLMTVHTAKGLEFPIVFVCSLNEGIFPSSKTTKKEELEEERRLAYVAFTRAMDHLFLTDAEGVNFNGGFRYPSRFIFNTEKSNLRYIVELPSDLEDQSKSFIAFNESALAKEKTCFKVGDQVIHKIFGGGIVKTIDESTSTYDILFEKFPTPRKLAMNSPLEKNRKINH